MTMECDDVNNLTFHQMRSLCVEQRGRNLRPRCSGKRITKKKLAKYLCSFYEHPNGQAAAKAAAAKAKEAAAKAEVAKKAAAAKAAEKAAAAKAAAENSAAARAKAEAKAAAKKEREAREAAEREAVARAKAEKAAAKAKAMAEKAKTIDMQKLVQKFGTATSFGDTKPGNIVKIVDGMILKKIRKPKPLFLNDTQSKEFRLKMSLYETELNLAHVLNHPNLIKVFGIFEQNDFGYICMELGTPSYNPPSNFNLRDTEFCRQHDLSVNVIFCAAVRDFSAGLDHVHDHGFIANDIKLKNSVMFDVGSDLKFKLIDFGQAKRLSTKDISFGQPWSGPPESIAILSGLTISDEDKAFGNTRVDEFLLGCMLLDILMWEQNYDRRVSYRFEPMYRIDDENRIKYEYRKYPKSGVNWLDRLVCGQPSQRISMKELADISPSTIRKAFEKLSKLPFDTNCPRSDTPDKFCMTPLPEAY